MRKISSSMIAALLVSSAGAAAAVAPARASGPGAARGSAVPNRAILSGSVCVPAPARLAQGRSVASCPGLVGTVGHGVEIRPRQRGSAFVTVFAQLLGTLPWLP